MDTQADSENFRELLDGMCLMWYGWPAKDEMAQAYFAALRDVRFSEVKENAQRIMRSMTKATPFPKPVELRNEPVSSTTPAIDAAHRIANERSARHWQDFMRQEPVTAQIEWRIARAARMMANLPEGDTARAEWEREYQRWIVLRYATDTDKTRALGVNEHGSVL